MRLPDIQLRGGTVIDGTGAAPFSGCVDITDGKISAVGGPELPAREIIDASGLTVTPGFIDAHTHADLAALRPGETDCFLYQGVTSCVCGNCGFSAFPLRGEGREAHLRYAQGVMGPYRAEDGWDSFADYQAVAAGDLPMNLAFLVGHGALRASVMGAGDRRPDPAETAAECALLDRQLAEGALGLSLGLIYSPGSTAAREEFLALAEIVRRHDAILAVHLRDEGAALPDSMEEIFSIARQTGVRVELSHHKVMGLRNWGLSRTSLALAEQARREGFRVGLDAYPYDAACSTGLVLLPPWALSGGVERTMELLADEAALAHMERDLETGVPGWENLSASCTWDNLIIASLASGDGQVLDRSIAELGRAWDCTPLRALARVLLRERGAVSVTIRGMSRADVDRILSHELTVLGSDGLFSDGAAHPRRYGAFAHFYRTYVHDGQMAPELAIAKMTGRTAKRFGLRGRGMLLPGYQADLAVFQADAFRDLADFSAPQRLAAGMEAVFVNGQAVLRGGIKTGARPGQILKKQ